MKKQWFNSFGTINITLDTRDAEDLASRGESIGTVKSLRKREAIESQLEQISPDNLRETISEYGAWSKEELQDHDENLNRLLWIAGCDIAERPDDYPTV